MITAIILTKNEEENIIDCLGSINWVDEIIIVDDFSDDNTVEVRTIPRDLPTTGDKPSQELPAAPYASFKERLEALQAKQRAAIVEKRAIETPHVSALDRMRARLASKPI